RRLRMVSHAFLGQRPPLAKLRRMRGLRQRSQGVVEFGLIIAVAAIVSIVGLSAMTSAQEAYWGASTPTFASPTPSTGTFLHPTSVDAPQCTPSPNVPLATPIVCGAPIVRDMFSNVSDRNPPLGTVALLLDGSDLARPVTCPLQPASSGSQNTCASGLTWTPTASALIFTSHSLSFRYESPQSNHVPS